VTLGYVLAVVGLIGLTTSVLITSGRPDTARLAENAVGGRLAVQAQALGAELVACATLYPEGDNGTPYRRAYPGATSWTVVTTLTCPGKPTGQQALFNTLGSGSAPTAVSGMGTWQYINDATSMRVRIGATDANQTPALALAATRLGSSASVAGSTLTFTLKE
jgi:hypothetical protein